MSNNRFGVLAEDEDYEKKVDSTKTKTTNINTTLEEDTQDGFQKIRRKKKKKQPKELTRVA